MAFAGSAVARLALLAKSGLAPAVCSSTARSFATVGGVDRKDIVALLHNRDDPEVDAAVSAYLKGAFAAAAKPGGLPAEPAGPALELTAQLERKYVAAQIVESGIQSIAVPLAYEKEGSDVGVRRYVAQLNAVAAAAGFEADPTAELAKKLADAAAVTESVKEFLAKARPYMAPDFHAGLVEAAQATEDEAGGSTLSMDGGSAGYKKFAARVQALAAKHKLPWALLVAAKKAPPADEEAADALRRDYAAWLQSAQVADAKADIAELKADAARLLDGQLSKSAEAIRADTAAAMATTLRKLEGAKGAEWAKKFQEDLKYVQWFDGAVAADPANGPRASA